LGLPARTYFCVLQRKIEGCASCKFVKMLVEATCTEIEGAGRMFQVAPRPEFLKCVFLISEG